MRPILTLLLAALALSACKPETGFEQVPPQLLYAQSVVDLGRLGVGDAAQASLQLDLSRRGTVDILEVRINPVQGTEGDAFFQYVGPDSLEVDYDGPSFLDIVYAPQAPGWHSASVDFRYRASGSDERLEGSVLVRGTAAVPSLEVLPGALDFGPVDVGDAPTRALTLRNTGDLDVVIDGFQSTDAQFAVTTPLPLTLGVGDDRQIQVQFAPSIPDPVRADLFLSSGDTDLVVALLANDCLAGTPDLWDQDGDGFTACAQPEADCDDHSVDANPAAPELPNGADDDCDGLTDEGTTAYDDDGDGFCEGPTCTDGSVPGDCADGDAGVSPATPEVDGNGIDDDCNGVVDAGTTDVDGDGYAPAGGDCDDTDPTSHPGAPELPDGVDNDCDLFVDEGTAVRDDDGDGYCEGPAACTDGALVGDCDDLSAATNPGAGEAEDWRDNDCDGAIDEGTDHDDTDGDGFAEIGGDCDDTDPAESPAQTGDVCYP